MAYGKEKSAGASAVVIALIFGARVCIRYEAHNDRYDYQYQPYTDYHLPDGLRFPDPDYDPQLAAPEAHEVTDEDLADILDHVVGKKPGQLAPLFKGVKLGMRADKVPDKTLDAIDAVVLAHSGDHMYITVGDGEEASIVTEIDVAFDGGPATEAAVAAALTARFGEPAAAGEAETVWLDKGTKRLLAHEHVHSTYPIQELRWASYRPLDAWVAPGSRARLGFEPFPLLGAPLAKVTAALGYEPDPDEDLDDASLEVTGYAWLMPGAGASGFQTSISAQLRHRKVVEWWATLTSVDADRDRIERLFTKKYGRPAASTEDTTTWAVGAMQVEVSVSGGEIQVHVSDAGSPSRRVEAEDAVERVEAE